MGKETTESADVQALTVGQGSFFVTLQEVQGGVEVFSGNLVNTNTGTSVAQPGTVVKWEEQTIRRCVTADFSHGQSDQLL